MCVCEIKRGGGGGEKENEGFSFIPLQLQKLSIKALTLISFRDGVLLKTDIAGMYEGVQYHLCLVLFPCQLPLRPTAMREMASYPVR